MQLVCAHVEMTLLYVACPLRLTPEQFERSRIMMRDKIRSMLRRPGFPGDITFGEIDCFDEKLILNLRGKIKILIDG